MNIPSLITVQPEQTQLVEQLACMVGKAFREELWHATFVGALDVSEDRKLAITQECLRNDFRASVRHGFLHATTDYAAAMSAYRRSKANGLTYADFEDASFEATKAFLTPEEIQILDAQGKAMEPFTTRWVYDYVADDQDFFYFSSVAVDADKRGSGAFGRLFRPFLAWADQLGLPCYLDCFTENLENIYAHYGFETLQHTTAPGFDITERCMVRYPQPQ